MNPLELAEMFEDKPLVIPPQKPIDSVPKPVERSAGWIKYKDLVAFIVIDRKGKPRMRTGHITSWPGSHGAGFEVDNTRMTIVWSDQELRMADNADDAYEKGFNPKDPQLLRLDELEPLKDPEMAVRWFHGIHGPEIARQISILISKPDLGIGEEREELWKEQKRGFEALDANLEHWRLHGRAMPKEQFMSLLEG